MRSRLVTGAFRSPLLMTLVAVWSVTLARPGEAAGAAEAGKAVFDRDALRVLSVNVLYWNPLAECRSRYRTRRDTLATMLADAKPDVVALQEVTRYSLRLPREDTLASLASELRRRGLQYDYFFWESESVRGAWQEGLGYLWRRDRVTPVDTRPSCERLPGTYVYNGLRVQKSLCVAWFRVHGRPELAPFALANTHLDSRRPAIREAQASRAARLLRTWLDGDTPALLAGDLNCRRGARWFRPDGWSPLASRGYDWVLGRDFEDDAVAAGRVLPLVAEGASDHDGLIVLLRLEALRQP